MLGMTNDELAQFFEVSPSTVDKWLAEIPAFSCAIKEGRQIADARVVESLYKRATGYEHADVDIRTVTLPAGGGSEIVQTPIVKHYPPDAASMIFWLKNRQPAKWRDKPEEAGGGDMAKLLAALIGKMPS